MIFRSAEREESIWVRSIFNIQKISAGAAYGFFAEMISIEFVDAQYRCGLCDASLDNTAIAKRFAITQQRQ
ncbi:MAG: hypothetical protein ACLPX7_20325 [Xanthobacteraceae bacterium]